MRALRPANRNLCPDGLERDRQLGLSLVSYDVGAFSARNRPSRAI